MMKLWVLTKIMLDIERVWQMKKLSIITAIVAIILSISIVSQATDYKVELKQLRYSSKIRATVIFHNNSGKDIQNMELQVALMDGDEIIAVEKRIFMGPIRSGQFYSEDYFWDGTTEADIKALDSYKSSITWMN